MVSRALALVVLVAGCQGDRAAPSVAPGSGSEVVEPVAGGFGSAGPDDAILADELVDAVPTDEPEPADPGAVIADLGAISAWQAVIDRWKLLSRRGQRGVVFGRLGPAVLVPAPPSPVDAGVRGPPVMVPSGRRWLVDDTEGTGSLGIQIELGMRFEQLAKEGERIAVGGAWTLDPQRRWYWAVDRVDPVPPAEPSAYDDPWPPIPTHALVTGSIPRGSKSIRNAGDNDLVYFQVVGSAPTREGDGWPIANELGDPVVALLSLPGERGTYGGQDMRTDEERWQLRRGQTYALRIGRIRKRSDDAPARINARTAPIWVR